MAELKRINFETGQFEANGKLYTIEGELSIERFAEFQVLETELAYGLTVKSLHAKHNELFELLNNQKFAEAAVKVHNIMGGLGNIGKRHSTVLRLCALYCNTEGEDRRYINQSLLDAKIEDWKKEGIAMKDFFTLALSLVPGLTEALRNVVQSISDAFENVNY